MVSIGCGKGDEKKASNSGGTASGNGHDRGTAYTGLPRPFEVYVWATTSTTDGAFTNGVTGADAYCQANDPNGRRYGDTYRALLHVDVSRDIRIPATFFANDPIVLVPAGSTKVTMAATYSDLFDPTKNLLAGGIGITGGHVWTGLRRNGNTYVGGHNCNNWTTSSGVRDLRGTGNVRDATRFEAAGTPFCVNPYSVMCLNWDSASSSGGGTVGGTAPSDVYVWITKSDLNGDLSGDTPREHCNNPANIPTALSAGREHRAVTGQTGVNHKAYWTTNPRVLRADGSTVVANTWSNFLDADGPALQNGISVTPAIYWTGLDNDGDIDAARNCSNWTSAGTTFANAGESREMGTGRFGRHIMRCNSGLANNARVLCVSW